jgi:hypothetical protein
MSGISEELYIKRFSAWAPGIENAGQWNEWAQGRRGFDSPSQSPEIAFTDPMFRRRLSQITKMTIQVVHKLLPLDEDTKLFFLSFRGEISKQFKINKMVIEDKEALPAAFSNSVFNAPIALASMAFGLKGGYTAVYPGGDSFSTGLSCAVSQLLDTAKKEIVFVYADEEAPLEYEKVKKAGKPSPFAFAFVLSKNKEGIGLSSVINSSRDPYVFLKSLIKTGNNHISA